MRGFHEFSTATKSLSNQQVEKEKKCTVLEIIYPQNPKYQN